MIHSAEQISLLREFSTNHIAEPDETIYNGFVKLHDMRIHDKDTVSFYLNLISRIKKGIAKNEKRFRL